MKSKAKLYQLRFYLAFILVVGGFYIYTMQTGWRILSFKETNHTKERTGHQTRIFYHK